MTSEKKEERPSRHRSRAIAEESAENETAREKWPCGKCPKYTAIHCGKQHSLVSGTVSGTAIHAPDLPSRSRGDDARTSRSGHHHCLSQTMALSQSDMLQSSIKLCSGPLQMLRCASSSSIPGSNAPSYGSWRCCFPLST